MPKTDLKKKIIVALLDTRKKAFTYQTENTLVQKERKKNGYLKESSDFLSPRTDDLCQQICMPDFVFGRITKGHFACKCTISLLFGGFGGLFFVVWVWFFFR